MKFYYDSLSYNNVVSKRYLVNYNLVESAEKDFLTGLSKVGYKIKGPLTYYIEATNKEKFYITFLIQTYNSLKIKGTSYEYSSYYGLGDTICVRIKADKLKDYQNIYQEMKEFCMKDNLKVVTPMFFSLGNINDKEFYYILSCGVYLS